MYDGIIHWDLLVRRINVCASKVIPEGQAESKISYEQLNLFTDYEAREKKQREQKEELEKEKRIQQAILQIQKRYGRNALLKGMNLEEGAMTKERNGQIGGHKA